jgi:alcohol dehydrogenase class IV
MVFNLENRVTTVSIIHSFTLPKVAIIDMLLWLEMKSNRLKAGGFNLGYGNKRHE